MFGLFFSAMALASFVAYIRGGADELDTLPAQTRRMLGLPPSAKKARRTPTKGGAASTRTPLATRPAPAPRQSSSTVGVSSASNLTTPARTNTGLHGLRNRTRTPGTPDLLMMETGLQRSRVPQSPFFASPGRAAMLDGATGSSRSSRAMNRRALLSPEQGLNALSQPTFSQSPSGPGFSLGRFGGLGGSRSTQEGFTPQYAPTYRDKSGGMQVCVSLPRQCSIYQCVNCQYSPCN